MFFPLVISIALALSSTPALASWEDLNEYGAQHRADMDRQHERQMESYRQEEQAAQYRNAQAAERLNNEPTRYDSPSYVNPTPQFLFQQGNGPAQLCTSSSTGVYCQ